MVEEKSLGWFGSSFERERCDEFVKSPSVDECCPVSGVETLTNVRVIGRYGLSSLRAWTYVIRAASVKLFVMDLSLVCQMR